MADESSSLGKTFKCSVCKTSKTDAWYKKSGTDEDVLCNFCCDSSGSCEPKEWIGLCVHCLTSEAAYPVYNSGFKQFACCSCYVEIRRKARIMRTAKSKEKSSASNEKQVVQEKKAPEQERVSDNRVGEKSALSTGKIVSTKNSKKHLEGYTQCSLLKDLTKISK